MAKAEYTPTGLIRRLWKTNPKRKLKKEAIKLLREGKDSYGLWDGVACEAYKDFDKSTGDDAKAKGIDMVMDTIDKYFDMTGSENPKVYIALSNVRKRISDIIFASQFVQHPRYGCLSDLVADVEKDGLEQMAQKYFPDHKDEIYSAFRKIQEHAAMVRKSQN